VQFTDLLLKFEPKGYAFPIPPKIEIFASDAMVVGPELLVYLIPAAIETLLLVK